MTNWLKSPFPFQFLFSNPVWAIGGLTVFVFLFLLVFEPFGFGQEDLRIPRIAVAVVYAIIPAVVILLHRFIFKAYLPFYSLEEQWTVGKELVLYVSITSVTGLLNTFASFALDSNASIASLPRELWRDMYHTVAIGILPIFILTLISYLILIRKNIHQSEINSRLVAPAEREKNSSLIVVTSPIKKDELRFELQNLLFIKSEGNYLDFFFESGERKTVRNSIQVVESSLQGLPGIFRCHRSYMVNIHKIKNITGNALGYVIDLGIGERVPVSRSKLKSFDELLGRMRHKQL